MIERNILVTGGAGFIGSHTCIALAAAGYKVIVLDDLSNSNELMVARLRNLVPDLNFIKGDVRDAELLANIFADNPIAGVIHFAALKSVSESLRLPLHYYDNNLVGLLNLLKVMDEARVHTLIFSSSATVYGNPEKLPLDEQSPCGGVTNPYGRSKLFIESILADLHHAEPKWNIARLRYFNPVGAHESGMIGEWPNDVPSNLMPYVQQVAAGLRSHVNVYGDDYPTIDGTGVRDYIHVMDLAEGHVAALEYFNRQSGLLTVNLGTGQGTSVLHMIHTFAQVNDCKIPYKIATRRAGDVASCWADVSLAERELRWKAKRNLAQMCRDSWRWTKNMVGEQSF